MKKRLVFPVIEARNSHRSAQGAPKIILPEGGFCEARVNGAEPVREVVRRVEIVEVRHKSMASTPMPCRAIDLCRTSFQKPAALRDCVRIAPHTSSFPLG